MDNAKESANNTTANMPDSLSQIQEIIVGDFLRQSRQNFDKLQSLLEAFKEETKARLDALESSINALEKNTGSNHDALQNELDGAKKEIADKLQQAESSLHDEIVALQNNKVDKSAIGEAFIQWGEKVKKG